MTVKKQCSNSPCIQEVSIALINLGMKNISDKLDNTNKILLDFIKTIEEDKKNYVTQKEHIEVKTRLQELTAKLWSINIYILLAVIWVTLTFIFKN